MSDVVLINFEGILDETQRDAIESAINTTIAVVRNILPYPPEDEILENYVFSIIRNVLLDPENDWNNPAFIFRLPDARPLFTALFLTAFTSIVEFPPAILDLQFTDSFPPEIDLDNTRAIPLHSIRQKAYQLRYSLVD